MTKLKRTGGQIQQIPNGLRFRQPEINWSSSKVLGLHPSFDTLVGAVISARQANPHKMAEHNWSTDPAMVAEEVEQYNVAICRANGWNNFLAEIGGGASVPFFNQVNPSDQRLLDAAAAKAKKIWSGITANKSWKESGEPAVPAEQSAARALICSQCPQNKKGDWTSWFTIPAANSIKKYMEWIQERKLSTPHDDKIQVCDTCLCTLHYKVHMPTKFIKGSISDEVFRDLQAQGKDCWIVSELGG